MKSNINPSETEADGFVDDYLLYLMAQASHAASAAFHAQLAAEGVPVATWRILASLYPDKALNVGTLARKCLMKQPTLTRQLDRLSDEKLVERAHETEDRRGVIVSLTDTGRDKARVYVDHARRNERTVLKDYSDAEISSLKTILKDLTRRMRGPQ